jgi:hypothetical protein
MDITMKRANIDDGRATNGRFFNGLNQPIRRIIVFLPYKTIVQLVHQAKRVEREVQEDFKYEGTKAFFATRNASNASVSTKPPFACSSKGTHEGNTRCHTKAKCAKPAPSIMYPNLQ